MNPNPFNLKITAEEATRKVVEKAREVFAFSDRCCNGYLPDYKCSCDYCETYGQLAAQLHLLKRVEEDMQEFATVDQYPQSEGRQMTMLLVPKKR